MDEVSKSATQHHTGVVEDLLGYDIAFLCCIKHIL